MQPQGSGTSKINYCKPLTNASHEIVEAELTLRINGAIHKVPPVTEDHANSH